MPWSQRRGVMVEGGVAQESGGTRGERLGGSRCCSCPVGLQDSGAGAGKDGEGRLVPSQGWARLHLLSCLRARL
jgi:hypothetical protein